jgi:hypothetical protein
VQLVFPLIGAAPIGTVLGRAEDANVDVCVVDGGDLNLAKEVQAVCRDGNANSLKVRGGEGSQIVVGKILDGAEVLRLVFLRLLAVSA